MNRRLELPTRGAVQHRGQATADSSWEMLTPDQIRAANIDAHVDQWRDFDWHFAPAVPILSIRSLPDGTGPVADPSPAGWARWLAREREMDDSRHPDDVEGGAWGRDFVHWVASGGNFESDTAVIVECLGAGAYGLHDGHHRTAAAHGLGMRALPAYVGPRRDR